MPPALSISLLKPCLKHQITAQSLGPSTIDPTGALPGADLFRRPAVDAYGAKLWSACSLLPLSLPQARLRELQSAARPPFCPRFPCHERKFQPASWLGKKRQQAARTPKLRSGCHESGSHGQCFLDRMLFSCQVYPWWLEAVAVTIRQSFGVEGWTHGHKGSDRVYPLEDLGL